MGDYKSKMVLGTRRSFDPANKQDLDELGYFIKNKKWKNGCPFHLEFPYSDVPAMCMAKYTEHSLA